MIVIPRVCNMNPLVSVLSKDLKLLFQILLQIRLLNQIDKAFLARSAFSPKMGFDSGKTGDYARKVSATHEGKIRTLY